MSEKFLLLERSLENDLEAIDQIYRALGPEPPTADEPEERLIVQAYRLHNLYNAFENAFRNIAEAFENTLDDRAGWHRQLLDRMRLDLPPIRPAVIDDEAFEKLDELRRFRHLFRSAYGVRLDAERLALVHRKAVELWPLAQRQLGRFLEHVRSLW
jgi:hypothetical protein